MSLKLIQVTDSQSGVKLTINVDNASYFFDMGTVTLIKFNGHDITVKESYEDVQYMLRNFI